VSCLSLSINEPRCRCVLGKTLIGEAHLEGFGATLQADTEVLGRGLLRAPQAQQPLVERRAVEMAYLLALERRQRVDQQPGLLHAANVFEVDTNS
jgi:hypothetical protein